LQVERPPAGTGRNPDSRAYRDKRDLKKLKELNIIKRIGADKGGYWEVVE